MKIGAWIHDHAEGNLGDEVAHAARAGIASLRTYQLEYSQQLAPLAEPLDVSLMAGIHVDSGHLIQDWRSDDERSDPE
jgi:hypothetical protein